MGTSIRQKAQRAQKQPVRKTVRSKILGKEVFAVPAQPSQKQEYERLIAESIPQIVWTSRPDGYNDHFNQRWFDYTGFTEEETYGETRSALHPDDKARYNRDWNDAVRTGKPYDTEYRLRRASDGMYRWHLGRAVPVIDADGRIVKWFGTCTDIHDQKMAEERMRKMNEELEAKVQERTHELHSSNKQLQSEIVERKQLEHRDKANLERLRAIVDTMPIGVLIAGDRSNIIHLNVKFCEMFETSPISIEDQAGSNLAAVFEARGPMHHLAQYFQRVLGHEQLRDDAELQLDNGKIVLCTYLPISVSSRPQEHLFIFRDITQERRIDAAKSEFMSLASHQLRTPLTAIRWALGRLEREMSSPMTTGGEVKLVRTAKDSVNRMSETINTMLMISRFEAGAVTTNPVSVDVAYLLEELKTQFQSEYVKRKQRFIIDCPDVSLRTDRRFLNEVLSNLISNAIKYTPEEGQITVSAHQDSANSAVIISVRDTGCGIPLNQQEKMFSKFFRADNIRTIDPNGTGLGLYLASLIVRMLSGTLTYVSHQNEGSTFTLKLPVA